MVDFQGRHRAAGLTSPAIAAEDLLPQPIVRRGIQPIPGRIGPHLAHDAFSPRPSKECLPLLARQEFEEPGHREQQCRWIAIVQVGSS